MDQLINRPAIKEHTAKNLAPLAPLLEASRSGTNPIEASSLCKAIQERFKHHIGLEKQTRMSMVAAGYENAMFMEGKQILRPDPWNPGRWIPYTPRNPGTTEKRVMNFFRFYTTNGLWKWQLSNPDIVAGAGVDTEQARESAHAADTIVEHHERRFFRPIITIQEGLHGMCWGTYIWAVRYDDTQHSVSVLQPIFDNVPVTLGTGWGQCGDCPASGPAANFVQSQPDPLAPPTWNCPRCGGEALVEPPATELMPSVVGQQQVDLGELAIDLKPFPECIWDFRHQPEQSSWFIHQRETSAQAVRRLLGNIRLSTGGEGRDDFGLKVMRNLGWAASGQVADQRKAEVYKDPVTVIEYSLGPDDIADIVLKSPEPTVGGDVIPAGPLLQSYPDGLTIQGLNGLTIITGMFTEHHSATHVGGVWHSKPGSGTGQGLDDLREVQKRFNSNDSQVASFFRASGTPAMLVRKEALGDTDPGYLGTGNINIPIISQNLPDGMKLDDIVAPAFVPPSMSGQFFSYIYQHLNNFAQLTSHITDFSGGLPGVKNNTATGAQITQANSNALFTPPLQVKGEVRLRIAEIVVALYRQHFPVERPFPLKGRHGHMEYRFLSAANLEADISFEVVRDSELPRNMFTKREDYFAFFNMLGGAAGYAQMREMDPEFVVELERAFNVQMNSETYNYVAALCQQRIAQLKQIAQFVPDPTVLTGLAIVPPLGMLQPVGPGVLDPPPVIEELDHQLKAKWLAQWLDFDEGQTAGPVMRACVTLLIRYHFQLHGQQQAEMAFQAGAVQTAAAVPGAIGGAVEGAIHAEVNPQPDVNTDVPDVNKAAPTTGRPKPATQK